MLLANISTPVCGAPQFGHSSRYLTILVILSIHLSVNPTLQKKHGGFCKSPCPLGMYGKSILRSCQYPTLVFYVVFTISHTPDLSAHKNLDHRELSSARAASKRPAPAEATVTSQSMQPILVVSFPSVFLSSFLMRFSLYNFNLSYPGSGVKSPRQMLPQLSCVPSFFV